MKPHIVRYLSVSLTPEVGSNDALLGVRVVPAGRDGHKVFGRTLADGEADSGEPVTFFPHAGEELHFPAGSVQIFLRDLDRGNRPGPDGYAPVSNPLWSWLSFGSPPDPALFRYLFAAARRLDTAHSLCADVLAALTDRDEPFIRARQRLFGALGHAELMCVAAGRAIDMLRGVQPQFSVSVGLPPSVLNLLPALHEIRNAFEHIEDRALNVRGKPHADALSIFDQRDVITQGVLRYAAHSLDLRTRCFLCLSIRAWRYSKSRPRWQGRLEPSSRQSVSLRRHQGATSGLKSAHTFSGRTGPDPRGGTWIRTGRRRRERTRRSSGLANSSLRKTRRSLALAPRSWNLIR